MTAFSPRICTDRREHPRFSAPPASPSRRYGLSLWDHEDQRWDPYRGGLTLMGLRAVIRAVEAAGWSSLSYKVTREDGVSPAGPRRAPTAADLTWSLRAHKI